MKRLLAIVALATLVSAPAFAQQVPVRSDNSKETVVNKCWAQALKQWGYKGGDDSRDLARNSVYRNCMHEGGHSF